MDNHSYMETTNNKPSKEQVLALDIATHTGYYSIHSNGTWNFTESKRRNDNKQHKDFRDTLIAYIQQYSIKQIVAEDVNVNNHFAICESYPSSVEFCVKSVTNLICRNPYS